MDKNKRFYKKIFLIFLILTILLFFFMKLKIKKSINEFGIGEVTEKNIEEIKSIGEYNGKIYYISEKGTSTDGTDINNPMSLHTAYSKKFKTGDKILFKRGDIFYGQVDFNIEEVNNELCYIGAYGDGKKPIISGAKIVSNGTSWEKYNDGIYRIDISDYQKFDGLKDNREDACNIGFWETENGMIYGNIKKSVELLKNENDFCSDGKFFYLKCNHNPYEIYGKIVLSTKVDLFKVSSNCNIEDLHIEYTGGHGMVKKGDEINNVIIRNNEIEKIGGSYQYGLNSEKTTRYGNGIEIWNSGTNIVIERNIIKNIYDAAITLQGEKGEWNNIDIRNNILLNTAYTFELWSSNVNTGMKNININNNISMNEGRGWSQYIKYNQQNSANIVLYGFVEKSILNINVYDNKFINSERLIYVTGNSQKYFNNGIYLKNNEYYLNETNEINDDKIQGRKLRNKFVKNGGIAYEINNEQVNKLYKLINNDEYTEKDIDNNIKYIKKLNYINEPLKNNIEKNNKKLSVYNNEYVKEKYNSLIENLNNLPSQTTSITKDTINSIYNQQYELINTIVEEFNNKKINISESEYQTLVTELLNISEQYKELFNAYITEDDIENSTIENNINNVIDRYNENKDIDMTMCAELINNIKEIYNDKIQTEETSYNYLNKRRIQNTCTIISKMLENKIKETAQQEAQKIGIAYNIDPSTLTNKDVIAQIKLPNSKSSIESNPNNEKYTFTENGTKNITINIRGYKYNYNIKVTNIDKTPPQITGIEQGGKYKESITPQITDENLSEVKLIKDGQEVENYKQNTAITQEGIYQLKATDKAGNETSINFVIAYPEDEKYKIENNTIKNIKGETSVETLKGKLQVDEKYTIKRKDTEIQNSENIATGDILETESGNKYTLIVRGDLNKDGKVDIKDLVKMRKFLLLGNNLDESEEMAADTNIDGKEISIKDLVKMRIILLTQ